VAVQDGESGAQPHPAVNLHEQVYGYRGRGG
jgi:hypothetical protein